MATKPYNFLDWHNIGEPLTPIVQMVFRGDGELLSFPDKSNRIYVEDATFSVLDDNGYSSASITLCDPDFINLEAIFLRAVFFANSLTIGEACWFVKALWGWAGYTAKHESDDTNYKTCKMHYYMLKDLTYELDDIELRVKVELMDIGNSAFAGTLKGDENAKITVGKLNNIPGVQLEKDGKLIIEDYSPIGQAVSRAGEESAPTPKALGIRETQRLNQTTNTAEGTAPKPIYNNILSGKDMTYWKAIQIVMTAQGFTAIALASKGEDKEPPDKPVEADGKIIIPVNSGFKETIDDLLSKIKSLPATNGKAGKHWGVLPGGRYDSSRKDFKIDMAFGWIPDPPKGSTNIVDNYRLARNYVYRPNAKEQIARGETLINSLSYNWTSRGAMAVGLPNVYGIGPDMYGKMKVWTNLDDWKNRKPNAQDILGNENGNPTVKAYSLQDLKNLKGVEVKFNFDSRTARKELIDMVAGSIVINMWNFFLSELVEINIDVPGDPWLDNTLFYDGLDYRQQDSLVDLYNCYFNVAVYKPGVGSSFEANPVLTGKYLCLKGCVHHISEGEYTTSLSLMKCF
jgi:hypothetical protein